MTLSLEGTALLGLAAIITSLSTLIWSIRRKRIVKDVDSHEIFKTNSSRLASSILGTNCQSLCTREELRRTAGGGIKVQKVCQGQLRIDALKVCIEVGLNPCTVTRRKASGTCVGARPVNFNA